MRQPLFSWVPGLLALFLATAGIGIPTVAVAHSATATPCISLQNVKRDPVITDVTGEWTLKNTCAKKVSGAAVVTGTMSASGPLSACNYHPVAAKIPYSLESNGEQGYNYRAEGTCIFCPSAQQRLPAGFQMKLTLSVQEASTTTSMLPLYIDPMQTTDPDLLLQYPCGATVDLVISCSHPNGKEDFCSRHDE